MIRLKAKDITNKVIAIVIKTSATIIDLKYALSLPYPNQVELIAKRKAGAIIMENDKELSYYELS
jgi:hypothetical protein